MLSPNKNRSSGLLAILWLVVTLCFVSSSLAAIDSVEDAVNRAGKQRMITQRLLKDYIMSGMGLRFGDPQDDLKQKVALFDQTLVELTAMNVNGDINKSLADNKVLWEPIKAALAAAPEQSKAMDLQKSLEILLKSCHKTTVLLSQASGSQAGEIVNISGRQRMLSQRLASLYMLKVWGVKDADFQKKLQQTIGDFAKAQKVLVDSPLSTPAIQEKLARVKKTFSFFEIMAKTKSGRYSPSLISKLTDTMLSEMDAVTQRYVQGK